MFENRPQNSNNLMIVGNWNDLPDELKPHVPNFATERERMNKDGYTPNDLFWEPFEHILFHGVKDYNSDEFTGEFTEAEWLEIDWYGVFASIQYVADGGSFEGPDEDTPNEVYMDQARSRLIKIFPDKLDVDGNPYGIPNPDTFGN